jgi:hypothetical protein
MTRYKIFQPRWLVAMSLAVLLGACSVPTPYQPSDGGYGYREQQIEDNRYRISFSGNPSTPRETVQNFLLYRAAELTVQNGFDYFTIADSDLERSTRYYSQGYVNDFGIYNYPGRRSLRRSYRPGFYSSNAYPINEYSSVADVIMAEGEKPGDDANAYDALDVLQQLQPLVRPPES